MDLQNLTIRKTREALDKGEVKVRDLVNFYLKNIEEKNEDLNIYLSVFDDIDEQVKEAQMKIDNGKADILTGIPFAVKANINIIGKNANCGSKILEKYQAPEDAVLIKKLKKQSPIFLGYVNMDEFACGGSGEYSAFGPTKNPLSPQRVPGGSSSGPAAAVAADMALVALGSDTGGSIRQPAAFCNLVGVKPTYGRVSRSGITAMGSSLDQVSPITRNVEDAKIVLEVISGGDGLDMTALENKKTKTENFKKIGVPRSFLNSLQPDILKSFENSLKRFKEKGYQIIDIDLDILKYSLPVYYVLMPAELSSNLARFDGLRYGSFKEGKNLIESYFKTRGELFGPEVKRRVILGTYVLSAGYADQYFEKALALREKIRKEFQEKIKNLSAIVTPTTATPPFKIGETSNPADMYNTDIFTVSANIIGNPAISVPGEKINWEGEKLPFGIQIMVNHDEEDLMFDIAKDFEK